MSKTLTEIGRQFERWSAGTGGGLLVLSPEDRRRRNAEILARRGGGQAAQAAASTGRSRLTGRLVEVAGRLLHRG